MRQVNRNTTILLSVVAFALPLVVPSWHGKLIALATVVWLVDLMRNRSNYKWPTEPALMMLGIMLVISFIGLIYSDDMLYGWSLIETFLPCIILPIIVLSQKNTKDVASPQIITLFFVGGVITLNLASLALISYDLWDSINFQSNITFANNRVVEIHPTFLSLYISISIFILIDFYFPLHKHDRKKLGWILFAMVTLLSFLLWLNSRAGLFAFLVTAILYFGYKYRGRARIVIVAILLSVAMVIVTVPSLNHRFIASPFAALTQAVAVEDLNDPNFSSLVKRKAILACSFQLIDTQHFLVGYGTGDGKQQLDHCLAKFQNSSYDGLDAHNEYVAQVHRLGLLGLVPFATLISFLFLKGWTRKSTLLMAFVLLFSITALFENVFSAQKGATFFALLCPLFLLISRDPVDQGAES